MRVHGVELIRATRGWVCEVHFSVSTHRQFTNEWHVARRGSKNIVLALVKGLIRARREAKHLQLLPGAFEL